MSHRKPPTRRQLAGFAAIGFAVTLVGGFVTDEAHGVEEEPPHTEACQAQYPYEGCTVSQAKAQEAGTHKKVKRHYGAHRWSQSTHEFRGMSKAQNRHFKRMYSRAVNRSSSKVALPFASWGAFKSNAFCAGSFSMYLDAWCEVDSWARTDGNVKKLAVKCGGYVISGAAVGATGAAITVVAIPPAALAGGAGGAVGCAVDTMYDSLW